MKECFKTIIDNIFLKRNPVGNTIDLFVPSNMNSNVGILVFDVRGKLVLQKTIKKQGNELSIPFGNFNSGMYMLKIGTDNTNTFKILK